jgi:hypothetical protein
MFRLIICETGAVKKYIFGFCLRKKRGMNFFLIKLATMEHTTALMDLHHLQKSVIYERSELF